MQRHVSSFAIVDIYHGLVNIIMLRAPPTDHGPLFLREALLSRTHRQQKDEMMTMW